MRKSRKRDGEEKEETATLPVDLEGATTTKSCCRNSSLSQRESQPDDYWRCGS
jgi:hypothetical protein